MEQGPREVESSLIPQIAATQLAHNQGTTRAPGPRLTVQEIQEEGGDEAELWGKRERDAKAQEVIEERNRHWRDGERILLRGRCILLPP